eukprot:scaffold7442_cov101-Isochrysis_galbana.AAC.2
MGNRTPRQSTPARGVPSWTTSASPRSAVARRGGGRSMTNPSQQPEGAPCKHGRIFRARERVASGGRYGAHCSAAPKRSPTRKAHVSRTLLIFMRAVANRPPFRLSHRDCAPAAIGHRRVSPPARLAANVNGRRGRRHGSGERPTCSRGRAHPAILVGGSAQFCTSPGGSTPDQVLKSRRVSRGRLLRGRIGGACLLGGLYGGRRQWGRGTDGTRGAVASPDRTGQRHRVHVDEHELPVADALGQAAGDGAARCGKGPPQVSAELPPAGRQRQPLPRVLLVEPHKQHARRAAACPAACGLSRPRCGGCRSRLFRPLALLVRFSLLRRRRCVASTARTTHLDDPRGRLDEHIFEPHRTGGKGSQPDGRRSPLLVGSDGDCCGRRAPDAGRARSRRRAHNKLELVSSPHLPKHRRRGRGGSTGGEAGVEAQAARQGWKHRRRGRVWRRHSVTCCKSRADRVRRQQQQLAGSHLVSARRQLRVVEEEDPGPSLGSEEPKVVLCGSHHPTLARAWGRGEQQRPACPEGAVGGRDRDLNRQSVAGAQASP